MKNISIFSLYIFLFLLPNLGISQKNRKKQESTISVSTLISFYPKSAPYNLETTFNASKTNLLLNFQTKNSGTFAIDTTRSYNFENTHKNQLPSTLVNVGASMQILRKNGLFHEFTLTKLSHLKSENIGRYKISEVGSSNPASYVYYGYKERISTVGVRYEIGKYLGKNIAKTPVVFGVSGGIEPTWYKYNYTIQSQNEYPISAQLFTIDVSLIPSLSIKLSKKVALDVKIIANTLMADFGSVVHENPGLFPLERFSNRSYDLPEIQMAGSIALKYQVKEPKKLRRKTN